jgi:hypothetical protein
MPTQSDTRARRYRGPAALGLLLATVVAVPLLVPGTPERAQARRYGNSYDYDAIIGRCKARCGGRNTSILACIKRDEKKARKNCKNTYTTDLAACVGAAPCTTDVKSQFRLCAKSAGNQAMSDRRSLKKKGYGVNRCNGCCQRTKGGGSCLSYFESSRFYGSYKYRRRLNCVVDDSGSSSGNPCVATCERSRKANLKACAVGKRAGGSSSNPSPRARGPVDPTCAARVEEMHQACLRGCTGSASGAFLPGVSDAIRSRLARLVPWLVEGWAH